MKLPLIKICAAIAASIVAVNAHAANAFEILELAKAGDELREPTPMDMWIPRWVEYVKAFNKKKTTLVAALTREGVEEKTLVKWVFSGNLHQKGPVKEELFSSWLDQGVSPDDLLGRLSIALDDLKENIDYDFSRLDEWSKYVPRWVRLYGGDDLKTLVTSIYGQEKMQKFLANANDKSNTFAQALARWIAEMEKSDGIAAESVSTRKRKRET